MQLKIKSLRLVSVVLVFEGFFLFFLAYLAVFQLFRSDFLLKLASKQHTYYVELEPHRGGIYDRNMRPLAVNVATFSLYAVPPHVKDKQKVVESLSSVLGLNESFVKERLSRRKQFVWLARKLDVESMERVAALKLAGLHFIKESKRSYPNAQLAASLIGFAGLDNIGLDGLEARFDSFLRGKSGWTMVLRDARQRDLGLLDVVEPPVNGHSLVLTIDQVIQYIVEREIDKMYQKNNAKGACVVVMDVKTGEILAMASRPTYDLNEISKYPLDNRRNRTITDFFEPGSVFKVVTAAAALDAGKFTVDDKIFCENGEYRVANHTLHDVHPYGTLTFKEVIAQSSNIGTTKIAQSLGPQTVYEYARNFGFGVPTGIGLIGEVGGVLKPVSRWSKTSIGAVPIGQEVCVTALQLVTAISVIANGGVYMKPYVVGSVVDSVGEVIKSYEPALVRRVISEETAAQMRDILTAVVDSGTGKLAQSKMYRMAGKTGTGQKIDPGGRYSHSKFMASFIGFAPADAPEIAVVVVADEPRPFYYGGVVSAPVFKNIAEDVLKYRALCAIASDDETVS